MWTFLIIVVGGFIAQNLSSRINRMERRMDEWRRTLNEIYADRGMAVPGARRTPSEPGAPPQSQPPIRPMPSDAEVAAPQPEPVAIEPAPLPEPMVPPPPVAPLPVAPEPIAVAEVPAETPITPQPDITPKPGRFSIPLDARRPDAISAAPAGEPEAAQARAEDVADPVSPPKPEPVSAPRTKRPTRFQPPKISFEELFGAKLPIWVGGISLAIAGLYFVIYVVEHIHFTPLVRESIGMAFALTLIALAEVARGWKATAIDQRVAQALAGAGIAVAYTVFLTSTNVYHLMSPGAGFVGLIIVTVGALGMALRYGAPCAVLGLVGGLAAPALVGQAPGDVKLLAGYLLLTICGIAGLARKQKWGWLAYLALLGGFGWGAVMLAMNIADQATGAALGGYMLMLGLVVPLLAGTDDKVGFSRAIPASIAALELTAFVARGGFTPFVWGFYGLISVGVIILALIDMRLKPLPRVVMLVGLLTAAVWPHPEMPTLYQVLGVGMLIFVGSALLLVWTKRGTGIDAGQATIGVFGGLALAYLRTPSPDDHQFALVTFEFAALFAVVAAIGWRHEGRRDDARFATLVGSAAALVAAGLTLALPHTELPPLLMGLALATLLLGRRAEDDRVMQFAVAGLPVAWLSLFAGPSVLNELGRAVGGVPPYDVFAGLWRYGLTALLLGVFSVIERDRTGRALMQAGAALLLTVAVAQLVPAFFLPIASALGVLVLAEVGARFKLDGRAAMGVFTLIAFAWALQPLLFWSIGVAQTLVGVPLLSTALPLPNAALSRIMIPTLLIGLAAWRNAQTFGRGVIAWGVGLAIMIALFVLYKHMFGLHSADDFVQRGLVERVLLTELMFAGGALAWMLRTRAPKVLTRLALVFTGLGLARTIWFEGVVFNPIWHDQWVGTTPLLNLLAVSLLVPLYWIYRAIEQHPAHVERLRLPQTLVQIAAILMFAYANIRVAFHGMPLAFGDISPSEDITRSLVAIGLAVGFLRWGISRGLRSWRIASLILMLGAVAKVFLFDAAGLTGLYRVFSFMALGMSLIGIGWLYSRHLRTDE
jgi:hypothetical protein